MGFEQFSGIAKTNQQAVDFKQKKAAGKDDNADQAKIFSVSARLNEARSKLQNARSQSPGQGLVYLDSPEQAAKKENSEAQLKVPPPKAGAQGQNVLDNQNKINDYKTEAQGDIDSLSAQKTEIQIKIDSVIAGESKDDLGDLRQEYSMINEASNVSKEHKSYLENNDLSTKDPDLLQKIENKKNEVLSLSFDKSKTSELSTAKEELDMLKAQLFGN